MTQDLARETLRNYAKSLRNGSFPSAATHTSTMQNPSCGDHIEVRVMLDGGVIRAAGFAAQGCAICTASASMLSNEAPGWSPEEFRNLKNEFETAIAAHPLEEWPPGLARFESFEHLRAHPRRRACAILPWLALSKAINRSAAD